MFMEKRFIDGNEIITTIVEGLKSSMTEVSSAKTFRYFLGDEKRLEVNLTEFAATLVKLMAVKGDYLVVDGEIYAISEYKMPHHLVDLVSAGTIYGSVDAIGVRIPVVSIDLEEVDSIATSPAIFNKFIENFNSMQGQGFVQFEGIENLKRKSRTLEDVQYLEEEDGTLVKYHDNPNGFDMEICSIIRIPTGDLSGCFVGYDVVTNSEIANWLLTGRSKMSSKKGIE